MRDAFRAGARPEATVAKTPTRMAAITPEGLIVKPPAGSEKPAASNRPLSRPAMPRPPNAPMTDATTPTAAVSATTDPSTWRRLAPRARSSADSRVRWATMIEKVL